MKLFIIPKTENKMCIGRESNPGRPRGRRAFYHWTTDAYYSFIILTYLSLYVYVNDQVKNNNTSKCLRQLTDYLSPSVAY